VALAIAVALLGYPVQHAYLRGRYAQQPVFAWAKDLSGSRIAIAGFDTAFPLFGERLQNRVQYLGHRGPHGEFIVSRNCREWRRQLRAGRYRFVVIGRVLQVEYDRREPPEAGWTRSIPGTVEVAHAGSMIALRVGSPPDPAGCP
jgi:hypothetical protein